MEFSFLKKHTRSHRFLKVLTQPEINAILDNYVPRLRSLQIFNVREFPEVQDEYYEKMDKIVEEAHESLKDQLRTKIKNKMPHQFPIVISSVVSHIAGSLLSDVQAPLKAPQHTPTRCDTRSYSHN